MYRNFFRVEVNTYVPIFRGLDARGGRKLRTETETHPATHTPTHPPSHPATHPPHTHTHTHTQTHTGQLQKPSLRACAPRVNNCSVIPTCPFCEIALRPVPFRSVK